MSNYLSGETSPYLLQHAENPVDWYPWCSEAFERAKAEDKPVFLSIGYSTCHWCHVMAHESFEAEDIAQMLNRDFICIKVDKEERPDIDSIYMTVCQAFTGSGGWPTSIFMTAEQKPFFAGTYFPRKSRGGMIGLRELLKIIADKWKTDRANLLRDSEQIIEQLNYRDVSNGHADSKLADEAVRLYKRSYDELNGGFGRAPKFPAAHNLMFLISYGERNKDSTCIEMAEHTLMQMYRGGIFDHIGGGFCRYSTDKKYLVPHFEKMLYDNALLIMAYCRAYEATGKSIYLEIAEKTAAYILREMTSPEGGFYSAQDADSDGEEGKYYLFSREEADSLLGADSPGFCRRYDISREGNFEGKCIPNLLSSDPADRSCDHLLQKLYDYRKKRFALHLDDKILTSWNGLMIAAMCRLYRAGGKEIYLDAAKKSERFILDRLSKDGRLYASFRDGRHGKSGFLDDYACFIFAQLNLYDVTLEESCLSTAEEMCRYVLEEFGDDADAGFFLYGQHSEKLIMRPKETYDGAIPSGNSVMAWNLVRLSQLMPEKDYRERAKLQLDRIASDANNYPTGYAMFLLALTEHFDPSTKVTVVLSEEADTCPVPLTLHSDTVVRLLRKPTQEYPLKNNMTTFYVCRNHTCLPPVNNLDLVL